MVLLPPRSWLVALAAAALAACTLPPPANGRTPIAATTAAADAARAPGPASERKLRVRLRGLHEHAPWTGTIRVRLVGSDPSHHPARRLHHSASQKAGADGVAEFLLPAWATEPWCVLDVNATAPYYRQVGARSFDVPRLDAELSIEVEAMARAAGRVLDRNGEPLHAAILAYRAEDERPINIAVAATKTGPDGHWAMKLPPSVPLLLAFVPILRTNELPEDLRRLATIGHGEVQLARFDLLPSGAQLTADIGKTTDLATTVPAAAAVIRGVALWSDGEKNAGAEVRILPRRGRQLDVSDHLQLQLRADGSLAPVASTLTDAEGRFALAAVPGEAIEVVLPDLHLGPIAKVEAAPGNVTFDLPRPVELQVMDRHDGVTIEVEDSPTNAVIRSQWARIPSEPARRVRAAHGDRRGVWHNIGPADAGRCIELELPAQPSAPHSR
jgi:hypothetical protein